MLLFSPLTLFWRWRFSHLTAAESKHQFPGSLWWKPSSVCWSRLHRWRSWEPGPVTKQGPLCLEWTAVGWLLPQAERRNLGWTPGLQINSRPSTFPFMTQPFFMKGFTVWGAGGQQIWKKKQQGQAAETIKSLKSRCKSSCSGLLLLCCGRKRIST